MADAGGVVYLLSSYQSGKERWEHAGVGVRERDMLSGGGQKGTPCSSRRKQQLLLVHQQRCQRAPFGFARIRGSSLTPLMWEINDETR